MHMAGFVWLRPPCLMGGTIWHGPPVDAIISTQRLSWSRLHATRPQRAWGSAGPPRCRTKPLPKRMADDLGARAIAGIAGANGRRHPVRLPALLPIRKPASSQVDGAR